MGSEICEGAAQGNHFAMLQWLRENKCPWEWRTCDAAIRRGHLEVLRWACENGWAFDVSSPDYLAVASTLLCCSGFGSVTEIVFTK